MSFSNTPPDDPFAAPPPPGYPSSPPMGSVPPPGGYPPPGGQFPGMPGGPQPIEPKGSSPWKYLLIGCAVLVALVIILGVGTCVFMGKYISEHEDELLDWGQKMASSGMQMAKSEYVNMLTSDHTDEQREEFSDYYDIMGEVMGEDLQFFMEDYGPVWVELNTMVQDQEITVRESQEWVDLFDEMLEQDGYWDEYDEYEQ